MKMNRAVAWFPECQINTATLLSLSLSSSVTLPAPLHLFFSAAIIFLFSSPLLGLKNWHVFDKGKSTPSDNRRSPSLSPPTTTLFPGFALIWNEWCLSLFPLYSHSKQLEIVKCFWERTRYRKSHKDGVLPALSLTQSETRTLRKDQ